MGKIAIKGGRVVDGSGKPGFEADVMVSGERIERVGKLGKKEFSGADVIDATVRDGKQTDARPGKVLRKGQGAG